MKDNMFYKASPLIFRRAEELRNRLTPAEEVLWNYLRDGQLGIKFRRQHPASIYILDFYAHKVKLAIELDGGIHLLEEVKRNDEERQKYLESLGIIFLRFTNEEVLTKAEYVIEKIKWQLEQCVDSPSGVGGCDFVIAAIDIIDGKCVRLTQGDYAQKKIYSENPLEMALKFEDIGIKRLHLVDLDGAKKGKIVNYKVLEKIAARTGMTIDFGGGINSDECIKNVFNAGAAIASIGSIAVKNKALFFKWIEKYGSEKILLGADVKEEKIAVAGWQEMTDLHITDFIKDNIDGGVSAVFCTDIAKDGLLAGPSITLYKKIIERFPGLDLIASGGVASLKDLEDLKTIGCSGAIVGKAIYENKITMTELKKYISQC